VSKPDLHPVNGYEDPATDIRTLAAAASGLQGVSSTGANVART